MVQKLLLALLLIGAGVAGRLLPHAWNFAPIIAIGLFSGAYLGPRFAFVVPVATMLISDFFIGFYMWQMNLTVYIAMGLSGIIGLLLSQKNRRRPLPIAMGSIAGSTLFFLVTNSAVWYFTPSYGPGVQGLLASLTAGIPFFRNAFLGDLWYSFAFFGIYELVLYWAKSRRAVYNTK